MLIFFSAINCFLLLWLLFFAFEKGNYHCHRFAPSIDMTAIDLFLYGCVTMHLSVSVPFPCVTSVVRV